MSTNDYQDSKNDINQLELRLTRLTDDRDDRESSADFRKRRCIKLEKMKN
jgi:hypothetical protein